MITLEAGNVSVVSFLFGPIDTTRRHVGGSVGNTKNHVGNIGLMSGYADHVRVVSCQSDDYMCRHDFVVG